MKAGDVTVAGLPRLARQLAGWIGTSLFGSIEPAPGRARRALDAGPAALAAE